MSSSFKVYSKIFIDPMAVQNKFNTQKKFENRIVLNSFHLFQISIPH